VRFTAAIESDTFKQRQLAALKRDLAAGLEQLDISHRRFAALLLGAFALNPFNTGRTSSTSPACR
jgi:hypothetical protein